MSLDIPKKHSGNQLLKCCNLFPPYFKDIDDMTTYLPHLKEIGMEVVWINPIQLTGQSGMSKADPATGLSEHVERSIYAMADFDRIDPRFSVVKRDEQGNPLFTETQLDLISTHFKQSSEELVTLAKKIQEQKSLIEESKNLLVNGIAKLNALEKTKTAALKPFRNSKKIYELSNEQGEMETTSFQQLYNEWEELSKRDDSDQSRIEFLYQNLQKIIHQRRVLQPFKGGTREVQLTEKQVEAAEMALQNSNNTKMKDEITQLQEKQNENVEELIKLKVQQEGYISLLDREAIKKFTKTAIDLGLTPIFDLVVNHLAKDAPYVKDHPDEFFNDPSFPDASSFIYNKLVTDPHLSSEQRSNIQQKSEEMILNVWEPFIRKYIEDYGFCGARVDCIRKIDKSIRQPLYNIIYNSMKSKEEKGIKPVILEEALFSDMSPAKFSEVIQNAGGTYITGSIYNNHRLWHGGLATPHNDEDFHKSTMVSNGTINFTGNHDHYSCAMKVIRELAYERLCANEELHQQYMSKINKKEKAGDPMKDAQKEIRRTVFMNYYINEIISELNDPEHKFAEINRFGKAYRDKFLTSMFAGSGGYYLFVGDELANLKQPIVFTRDNGKEIYPTTAVELLTNIEDPQFKDAREILKKMAMKRLHTDNEYRREFKELSESNKEIFLSAYLQQIHNELNTGVKNTVDEFLEELYKDKSSEEREQIWQALSRDQENCTYQTQWAQPKGVVPFANKEFIIEMNGILSKLPKSEWGFRSELFKATNENIFIAVRQNSAMADAPTDIIIVNLDPYPPIPEFNLQDMEKLAMWLQLRYFPDSNQVPNPCMEDPAFQKTWGSILGHEQHGQKPANLYFGGNIRVSEDIKNHRIKIEDELFGFNIVVEPSPKQENKLINIDVSEAESLPSSSDVNEEKELLNRPKPIRLVRDENPLQRGIPDANDLPPQKKKPAKPDR